MAFITLFEVMGILIVTAVVGYIFSSFISMYRGGFGPLTLDDYKLSIMIAAPAIILHEMGHKFVGLAFGLPSVFNVFWEGLGLALILRWINSPILLLAPAYVTVPNALPIQSALIAFAGPAVNLVLWLGSAYYLKHAKNLKRSVMLALGLARQLNKWLFIFNMIPIPPLDGFNVVSSLYHVFF